MYSCAGTCNRKARRFENVLINYTKIDGTKDTATAINASIADAAFETAPWTDKDKIKDVSFNLDGIWYTTELSQVSSRQDTKLNKDIYIVEFKKKLNTCRRKAHRYEHVIFRYTDGNQRLKTVVASNASITGAHFKTEPPELLALDTNITFEINGVPFKAESPKKVGEQNNGRYAIEYKAIPDFQQSHDTVISKMEETYLKVLESVRKNIYHIPINKTRLGMLSFLILLTAAFAFIPLFPSPYAFDFKELLIYSGTAIILCSILAVYAIKSQKDLQEYQRNDRRLAIANYLEVVMVAFALIRTGNVEKGLEKIQKAGELLMDQIYR